MRKTLLREARQVLVIFMAFALLLTPAVVLVGQGPGTGSVVFDTEPTFNKGIKLKGTQLDQFTLTISAPTATANTTVAFGEIAVSYSMNANADLADQTFFLANRAYEVTACRQIHSTAGSDGGAVTLQVVKDTGTDAPGAGTDLLTSTGFNLKGTANTTQAGTLVTTLATKQLAAGNRLAVDFAGVLTAVAGVLVTCNLKPI